MTGSEGISKVSFGRNANQRFHTFRHVQEAGLSIEASEAAIRADLAGTLTLLPDGLTLKNIHFGGKILRYSAFRLPDGVIHVGRITVR